jgi:hypothetical protein
MTKLFLPALAFMLAAVLVRFWLAPQLERLPANYASDTQYQEEDSFRASPTGAWQASILSVRRVDQAVTATDETVFVDGALHVYFATGAVNFESTGLYGVDRRTGTNVSGYGDVERSGQDLFPPHVQRGTYRLWDPMFIGPRQAAFDHADTVEGLPVDVYQFEATGLDETAGYSSLPDVPERYLAHTDGKGTLWLEPVSGIVVDYSDEGVSYFVDPVSGRQVADFNKWSQRSTPETRLAQVALARAARLRILALEDWLPGGLTLLAAVWVAVGAARRKRRSWPAAVK